MQGALNTQELAGPLCVTGLNTAGLPLPAFAAVATAVPAAGSAVTAVTPVTLVAGQLIWSPRILVLLLGAEALRLQSTTWQLLHWEVVEVDAFV